MTRCVVEIQFSLDCKMKNVSRKTAFEEREKIPQKIFITFKNWLSKTKINFTFKTLSCPQTMLNVLSANGLQKNLFIYFHWRAQYELLK